jgi:hypothetical protein
MRGEMQIAFRSSILRGDRSTLCLILLRCRYPACAGGECRPGERLDELSAIERDMQLVSVRRFFDVNKKQELA